MSGGKERIAGPSIHERGAAFGNRFRIAWRGVSRHWRQTAITAAVMVTGIALFILADSVLKGMDRLTIDTMERHTSGSLRITTAAYAADERSFPLDAGFPSTESSMRVALDAVRAIEPGAAATPRLRFVAEVSNGRDSLPVAATALDPVLDVSVFGTAEGVSTGSWLRGGEAAELALGRELAAELGVGAGDYVYVQASDVHGNLNADEYLVACLLDSPAPEVARNGLFMALPAAWRLLDAPGLATEICLSLPRRSSLDEALDASDRAAAAAEKALDAYAASSAAMAASVAGPGGAAKAAIVGSVAESLREAAGDYLAMRQMKGKYSTIMILVVLAIAAVGIVNTVLMSVYSRVREIGVLKAYGMRDREIGKLFALEGLIVGFLGSCGGAVLGVGLSLWLSRVGISIEAFVGKIDMGDIPLAGRIFGELDPKMALGAVAIGVLVSWLSAALPARRAARLPAVEALRFV